jgi:hypothetical protein
MLARVQRLEQARAPVLSPFALAYGSTAAFTDHLRDGTDPRDLPDLIAALERWDRDGLWSAWQRNGSWQLGASAR